MTASVLLYSAYEISSIAIRLFMLCYIPQKHTPSTATAWLLAIYFWPWPGFLLYSLFGSTSLPQERIEQDLASALPLWVVPQAFGGGEGWRRITLAPRL